MLQTFDSRLFNGQNYFNNDEAKLYLIFQAIYKTVSTFSGFQDTVLEREFKGLLNEGIKLPYTSNISLSPRLVWRSNSKIRRRFTRSCFKQEDNAAYTPSHVVFWNKKVFLLFGTHLKRFFCR